MNQIVASSRPTSPAMSAGIIQLNIFLEKVIQKSANATVAMAVD